MRKFIIPLMISVFLFSNSIVFSQIESENPVVQTDTQVEEVVDTGSVDVQENSVEDINDEMGLGEQRQIVIDDVQSSPNDNTALTKKVVPDTRSELTKMVKMFLKVMLAVAISSVVIFVVLLFVRRFYAPMVTLEDLNADDDKKITLDTPQNKNEALKTFLDKTKET